MATFGEKLRALMSERKISQRKLAKLVPCSDGYLSRLATGDRRPSEQTATRLDELLGAEGELLALSRRATDGTDRAVTDSGADIHSDKDEEMQRRRLLQALAALGVATPAVDAIDQIRQSVDRAIGRDEDGHLDEWEETVAEYGYTYQQQPPRQLLNDLAADMVILQRVASRHSDGPQLRSWQRVTGGLSVLMAKTLSNLGESRLARDWWMTAQHAADSSHDVDLSLWISGERLVYGLYENRPTETLLHKTDRVLAQAPATPRRGLIHVRAVRAQLLSMEKGSERAAADEIRTCEEIYQRLPAAVTRDKSTHGWGEDRLRYTQAWVHAHTRKRDQLDATVARAHTVSNQQSVRVRTQLDLMRAAGHVRAGDTTEGVRFAHAAYEALLPQHRALMVTSLAHQVAAAVPANRRAEPTVSAYRELLASGSERKAIT
ncbi:helix-turn-helix protein [Actinomadura pelletieri DSM 43383]|uniref:Helix-turn-helix protein n=1 Tax=Actinomadura pelletieri DSM 43383 TaxID=1120940 RepID=A0A495QT22_9ACTN|nr:helix-turn-helix transcriptional regulator [Actinomadura pelletieri]RKS76666.1 helix-turn-helix protein [Actinomadura pelletieri DSM 43383]